MSTNEEPKKRTTVAGLQAVNDQLQLRIETMEQQLVTAQTAQVPQVAEADAFGEQYWKRAGAIARSTVIPKDYQGQTANVFVAMEVANRMQIGVFEVMQNLNVIHGSPAWSSSYAIGLANQRGPFKGPIQFEADEKAQAVTAFAIIRETGKRVEYTVTMAMAKADGWAKNAKYQSIPMHMLRFRSATFLIRTTCPEVLFGMQTTEEHEDIQASKRIESSGRLEVLNREIVAPPEPVPAPEPIEVQAVEPEPTPEPEKTGNREFF